MHRSRDRQSHHLQSLLSLLNARQLGLKLMANVTYGYTSATYSGRMPCIEVADSIVQTGRETLEKVICSDGLDLTSTPHVADD